MNYYNEWDQKAAAWLRELIAGNLIPPGDVDERSICDVDPDELAGYRQLHFFAGIGGWPLACRIAGWPDEREIVTGSCPCQPFSVAGKGAGAADERHLWPDFFRIIRARRPAVVMGEQVAAAIGKGWLVGVRSDLESIGYDTRGIVIPACAVNAPHRRDRLWFAARSRVVEDGSGCSDQSQVHCAEIQRQDTERSAGGPTGSSGRNGGVLEHGESHGRGEGRTESGVRSGRPAVAGAGLPDGDVPEPDRSGWPPRADHATAGHGNTVAAARGLDAWDSARWLIAHDGKARRVEPGIPLLVDGIPDRVGLLRGFGNAIVPQVAAEMMAAWMEEFPT